MRDPLRSFVLGLLVFGMVVGCGGSPSPRPTTVHSEMGARMAEDYLAHTPLPPPPDTLTLAGAYAVQKAFVDALIPTLGPPVGYKAGLTAPGTQARFGATEPIRGVFLRDMLRSSGAIVPAAYGVRPVFEGDLVVRVGDEAINTAESDEALLAALDAVIPFIELPDLLYDPAYLIDARGLVAVNAGARMGVLGPALPPGDPAGALARLGAFRVKLYANDGTLLAEGRGTSLLDHPVNVLRWLRDALHRDGLRLTPGDLLSLGSLTPLVPVQPGQTITARYEGLTDEPVEVTVTFR